MSTWSLLDCNALATWRYVTCIFYALAVIKVLETLLKLFYNMNFLVFTLHVFFKACRFPEIALSVFWYTVCFFLPVVTAASTYDRLGFLMCWLQCAIPYNEHVVFTKYNLPGCELMLELFRDKHALYQNYFSPWYPHPCIYSYVVLTVLKDERYAVCEWNFCQT